MNKKPEHPYFDAWLRRTRKQLSISGRISQIAHVLAGEDGSSPDEWQKTLRHLIDGRIPPTFEMLSKIEALLTPGTAEKSEDESQLPLF